MIEFTRFNLLPYREAMWRQKQQEFQKLLVLAVIAGVGLSFFAYIGINKLIDSQANRNRFLDQQIAKLEEDIVTINKLKAEREAFLIRKRNVVRLQEKKFEAARVIDSLNILLPQGAYIVSVTPQTPITYTVLGKAVSNNKVAVFMNNIPTTGVFVKPELVSIKKADDVQEFSVRVSLKSADDSPGAGR